RPVGEVAHEQDDQEEPPERLDRRPGPAVAIEQAEHGPPPCCRPARKRPLRHRPPSSPGSEPGTWLFDREGPRHRGMDRALEWVGPGLEIGRASCRERVYMTRSTVTA